MRKTAIAILGVALLAGGAMAENLLTNGDFEQPLTTGWTEDVRSIAGSYRIERTDTMGQPEPGFAAKTYKYLAYYSAINQTVDVPDVDLTLSFDGRLVIGGGSSTCWPAAAFTVHYLDDAGASLGRTMWLNPSVYCTWTENDTFNIILVETDGWSEYQLDIASELSSNLPAIDAEQVAKIKVEMFSYDNGT